MVKLKRRVRETSYACVRETAVLRRPEPAEKSL